MQFTSSRLAITIVAVAAVGREVPAQDAPRSEIRAFAGTMVPIGQQARDFATAPVIGSTLATWTGRRTRTIASLSWAPTVNHFTGVRPRVNLVTWDIGVEIAAAGRGSPRHTVPFGGIGLGARSYEYAGDTLTNPNFLSGYLSAGVELRRGRPNIRLEARDYTSTFRSPIADRQSTRNDLTLSVGVAYSIRE